jgi:hypothetical protein
MRPELE